MLNVSRNRKDTKSFTNVVRAIRIKNRMLDRLDRYMQMSNGSLTEKHLSRIWLQMRKEISDNEILKNFNPERQVTYLKEKLAAQIEEWAKNEWDWKHVIGFLRHYFPTIVKILVDLQKGC